MHVSDQEFNDIIAAALDELPEQFIGQLSNVLITYENDPSPAQRQQLGLRCHDSLFGLYEGIPLTKRASASSLISGNVMTMPDRITLFKNPLLSHSHSLEEFKRQVKHTLWHEIAHYYGLDHDRIHAIEHGEV